MRSRLIPARFKGRCRTCGGEVHAGQPVWFAKHYGVRCSKCGPHTASDGRLPSKRELARPRIDRPPAPSRPAPIREYRPVPMPMGGNSEALYLPVSVGNRAAAEPGSDGVYRITWADGVGSVIDDAYTDYAQNDSNREFLTNGQREHARDRWANRHDEKSLRRAIGNPDKTLLDAVDELRGHLSEVLDLPTTPRRRVRRGQEWGDELDSDRVLARDPYAWDRVVREAQPTRTVTIGVNLTVYCTQKPEDLLYRGAAACVLADVLTRQGLNVRILGFSVGGDCSNTVRKLVSTVELKRPDMPLDVAALATAVCDIGFYRLAVLFAEFRHLKGNVSHGLGVRGSQHLPAPDRKALDYLVESHVTSKDAAITWLREQVNCTQTSEFNHVN